MEDVLGTVLKLVVLLPIMIFSIYYISKIYAKTNNLNGKNMKVVERVFLSKDNSISLVKIGNKFFVIASSTGKVKILKELEEDELENYDKKIKNDNKKSDIISKLLNQRRN